MAKRLKVDMRVSMLAKKFDIPRQVPQQRCSYSIFGESWETERIYGTIKGKVGDKFFVKFDVDGENHACESRDLRYEEHDTPLQLHPIHNIIQV